MRPPWFYIPTEKVNFCMVWCHVYGIKRQSGYLILCLRCCVGIWFLKGLVCLRFIWYGVVNYVMVWYGVVHYCIVCYGLVYFSTVWYGIVWPDVAWYWYILYVAGYDILRYSGMLWILCVPACVAR